MPQKEISLADACRIALAAQGFGRPRPRRPGPSHLRRTIRQLGLLQLDFVNVLIPAHYLVLFSRLGPYDRALFDRVAYRSRHFTEQWAHERSLVPVESWPLFQHRRDTHRVRPWGFEKFLAQRPGYVVRALAQVRQRGPLTADNLPELEGLPRRLADKRGWGMKVKNQVLEAHFGFGRLAIASRLPNFARAYDLAERLIPARHLRRRVDKKDSQRELLRLAARAHGIATVGDLADYYRMSPRDARPLVAELVEAGELREVRVEGWREPAYLHPQARAPRALSAAALLSPFDPVVWTRERAARLFGFDYRVELFVPPAKRKWGYYVLPFLLGDRLVARVDLKADRASRRLLVQAAYSEKGSSPTVVAKSLAAEIQTLARWLRLDSVTVSPPAATSPAHSPLL